ncbi:Sensor histidine kinase YesM [Paenibacillus sp. yr247]|uniref:cache domain-containing sensor histidine kinase n=1 Tax=Paenibacillus sp. yr247 TaxID=1761880 RepID=UPI00088AD5CC|nr:histidine kinase [Paenibacillus sp. yr247]SDO34931.1 Sensor histidine kinase YesM [Paenibacillus sp. yr247]
MFKLQQISLQKKLLIMMLFLYFPLPVIGWIWYEKTYYAIESNAIDSSIEMINQVNAHLETYFSEVERTMLPILASDDTATFLNHLNDDPIDPITRYELSYRIEKELLSKIMLNRSDIYGISLISDRIKATSSSSFMLAEERYPSYLKRIKYSDRFTIMGLETTPSSQVIGMAMRFSPPQSGLKQGMLIVDLKRDEMVRIIQNVHVGKTGFIWLADSANQVIYHPQTDTPSTMVPEDYLKGMGRKQSGTFMINTPQGKKLVVFIRSDRNDLTLFSEVLLSELNQKIVTVSRISVAILVFLFLLSMLAASGVVYSLTKSLVKLLKLMKRAELGDFTIRAPSGRGREIDSLFRGFNKMVEEIKRLIEIVHVAELREKELEVKKKESLLHAMQAQINPHFLYNTLEFINSNAIIEGNEKISNMIVSLGDMFRYNVQSPNGPVFLSDEIRHIESYLAIQSERHSSLAYEIEVDRTVAAGIPAVRSTLQPIIENCFKHGYEKHKLRPGYISIRDSVKDDNRYILEITDTGKGMSLETMEFYNKAFSHGSPEDLRDNRQDESRRSIGLFNVHTRIRMLFGEPYGLFISVSNETGTTIQLSLPIRSESRKENYNELSDFVS